jgi:hypothetical protein
MPFFPETVPMVPIRTLAILLLPVLTTPSWAQGEIDGRVVAADSGRPPIQGVEASIAKIGRNVLSDSSGRFRLKDVPPGEHLVVLRAFGFKAESSKVFVNRDEVVSWDVVLTRTVGAVLPERVVEAAAARPPAKLVEFIERQRMGSGHFITRKDLEKAEGGMRLTGDVISTIPGVWARRGGSKIWIASGRTRSTGCAFCRTQPLNRADSAAGARPACYMDVYVDGAQVYDSRSPETGLFDVNTVPPDNIAGIEIYTSAVQIPVKYNKTSGGCGVLLIWTR